MTVTAPLPDAPIDRRAQFAAMALAGVVLGGVLLAESAFPTKVWFPGAACVSVLWIAAAAGYGRVLRRVLFPRMEAGDPRRTPLAIGLGVAFALAVVAVKFRLAVLAVTLAV